MNENQNPKGYPFRFTLYKDADSITAADLKTDPLSYGEAWAVHGLTVRDNTNNVTSVQVLAGRLGVEVPIHRTGALNAGVPNRFNDAFWLTDGEHLIIRFAGATVGDDLTVTIEGDRSWRGKPETLVELHG